MNKNTAKLTFNTKAANDNPNCPSRQYSSGELISKRTFNDYGIFEIRCKLSSSIMYPAFWLYGWSTEIDIFECNGNQNPFTTFHKWSTYSNDIYFNSIPRSDLGQTYNLTPSQNFYNQDLSQNFHVYTCDYGKYYTIFYIDGIEIWRNSRYLNLQNQTISGCNLITNTTYLNNPTYPRAGDPLAIIAGLASFNLGSLPQVMEVDYIKVFKHTNPDIQCSGAFLTFDNLPLCPNNPTKNIKLQSLDPQPTNVQWSSTSNLSITPVSSTEVNVSSTSSSYNYGTVSAQFTDACNNIITYTVEINNNPPIAGKYYDNSNKTLSSFNSVSSSNVYITLDDTYRSYTLRNSSGYPVSLNGTTGRYSSFNLPAGEFTTITVSATNSSGCPVTKTFTFNYSRYNFMASPNPATSNVKLAVLKPAKSSIAYVSPNISQVVIQNLMSGEITKTWKGQFDSNDEMNIDVSSIRSGSYVFVIKETNGNVSSVNFVKL